MLSEIISKLWYINGLSQSGDLMLTAFFFLIYNIVLLPILYMGIYTAALFNNKIRKGLIGRHFLFKELRKNNSVFFNKPVLVLHCASMGEFEHTKPFLMEFKKVKPEFKIIVIFFSPSGYENVKTFSVVDLFLYSPNEWIVSVWRFIRHLKPKAWVIAKHDVWPNQVWFCRFFKIPLFLINASLHTQSGRLSKISLSFYRSVYLSFMKVLTISEDDSKNLLQIVPSDKLVVVGDTKYDQVIYRRDESQKKQIISQSILKERWVFIAGSTWPADHQYLFPTVMSLKAKFPGFLTIICPHEPSKQHLDEIYNQISANEFILLSDINNFKDESFIIIDRVGVLANLYGLGKAAYVGGGFRQNVHNVLEAAVYKIPVIFGPVNHNSHEAQLLKKERGGWEVSDSNEIEILLERFILNDIYRQECGLRAYRIVELNRGATQKTVHHIISNLTS
jgi:3-deoxy-D-manno-octulosonic-acid transferase